MESTLTTIYIVRHGETEWNLRKIVQGQKDSPLTQKGIEQANDIAKKFKNVKFDKIFSSDILRAKRTAEIISLEKQLAIESSVLLREQNFGRFEGTDRQKFFKLFDKWDQLSDQEKHTFKLSDDMESNEEAVSRLITFLREVSLLYTGKTVLVVCHGGIMRYLAIHLGYMKYHDSKAFDNCGHMILSSDGVDLFVKEVSGLHTFA